MPPKNVIGTLHQQAAEVDVPSLGDTELKISLSGLTPFRLPPSSLHSGWPHHRHV